MAAVHHNQNEHPDVAALKVRLRLLRQACSLTQALLVALLAMNHRAENVRETSGSIPPPGALTKIAGRAA